MIVTDNTGLDVELISPSNGAKYSPNLYRWLSMRSSRHRAWTSRIFRDADGVLWIGIYDAAKRELMGSRLMSVLRYGALQGSAAWQRIEAEEVVGFWDSYVRDGRCAVDEAHELNFKGDDTRWSINGDARACQWCGNVTQKLQRWTETVERQAWISSQGNCVR